MSHHRQISRLISERCILRQRIATVILAGGGGLDQPPSKNIITSRQLESILASALSRCCM